LLDNLLFPYFRTIDIKLTSLIMMSPSYRILSSYQ